ncbi:hypothetical protein [Bdellovibrio sp. HCB288]|uniref:hypothetical protein n=1 Tax=Bdellovibrio sp. HCB288 TaxID=3394355 RepID=UPI0039B54F2A
MPYAAKMFDPNEENNQNQSQNQGGVNISGGSGANFTTGIPGQNASSGGKQKTSGQYANIQSYLDANQDQGDQMGQKITDKVSTQADDANQKIDSFKSSTPGAVEAYDPGQVINNISAATDSDKDKYKEMKSTGGYTGPQAVDQVAGYQDAQKATAQASQQVANAGTEAGQQQLLRDAYARPKYSAGENRLDQVLLQNSSGSRAALDNLNQKYSGLGNLFNDASTQVDNAIQTNTTQALNNKNAFASAEQAGMQAFLDPIQSRADQYNANAPQYADRIKNDASDYTLSDETLQALGLSEGQNVYNTNLSNFVSTNKSQANVDNMATADERSKYAALAALFDDPTLSQITSGGQAFNPVAFDKAGFDAEVASQKSAYDNLYNTQVGGILNNQYLSPEWAADDKYKRMIPGALTERRDIYNATAKDLESFWLPLFQQATSQYGAMYAPVQSAVQQSLDAWKKNYLNNIQKG